MNLFPPSSNTGFDYSIQPNVHLDEAVDGLIKVLTINFELNNNTPESLLRYILINDVLFKAYTGMTGNENSVDNQKIINTFLQELWQQVVYRRAYIFNSFVNNNILAQNHYVFVQSTQSYVDVQPGMPFDPTEQDNGFLVFKITIPADRYVTNIPELQPNQYSIRRVGIIGNNLENVERMEPGQPGEFISHTNPPHDIYDYIDVNLSDDEMDVFITPPGSPHITYPISPTKTDTEAPLTPGGGGSQTGGKNKKRKFKNMSKPKKKSRKVLKSKSKSKLRSKKHTSRKIGRKSRKGGGLFRTVRCLQYRSYIKALEKKLDSNKIDYSDLKSKHMNFGL
jgi:hypothetical protein